MRTVGVDTAGGGLAAAALAIRGVPSTAAVFKPDKKDAAPEKLFMWGKWLDAKYGFWRPDVISVEELAVFMNKKVIRALSKMEGVAIDHAKKKRVVVLNPPITQARSIVFRDQGVRSKEDAFEAFKKKYPDFKLPAVSSGGMDVADAMVHAVAAPIILERRK